MQLLYSFVSDTQAKIIGSIFLIVLLYTLRSILWKLVNRRIEDLQSRYMWRQMINYGVFAIGCLATTRIWFEWFQSILTLLSLLAAGITIVSKEFIINLMAYGVIIWRGQFDIGDRIQIGPYAGDVIEVGPLFFAIAEVGQQTCTEEPTGRVVKIPNATILSQPLANYSRGLSLVWNEIVVDLNTNTDWQQAKTMAQEIAETYTHQITDVEMEEIKNRHEEIIFTKTAPSVYCRMKDGKISLTIRYICKINERRTSENLIWEALLKQLPVTSNLPASAKT